ncbi:hypothetical protein UA08_07360 [Talaromyces atroroseus]|uniref:Uncharacterized protein n=1 Tax=Talaromyces atroroseus TaxID=1441469 RepID=A0A225AQJ4_TALAT|nr:hypothetical protein UA08_07360 [Talaromyces atroroseus]OKL57206.1 hypothetical protein UA08_07360 [Talaromyces atroroseus]
MDVSSIVATWLSFAATVIGLSSLVTHVRSAIAQADPFLSLRDTRHLGWWCFRQPYVPWYCIVQPPPLGPVIHANLLDGLCGRKTISLSRLPLTQPAGQACKRAIRNYLNGSRVAGSTSRSSDETRNTTCTIISRATFMALLAVTNARPAFLYNGSSGHRAAYASYCGQWLVEWQIGGRAVIHFAPHDSHTLLDSNAESAMSEHVVVLDLPSSKSPDRSFVLYVPEKEGGTLNQALDCLPWTPLSWSAHRGLRDILVAFAKTRMDMHRDVLAATLHLAVSRWPEKLDAKGWNPNFVRENMADMAASAVLAGSGISGGVVRIVTDIALLLWDGTVEELDETTFWRDTTTPRSTSSLSPMTVVALVKCFVLEWSVDLDYQMYHDLPMELYFG